MHGIAAAPGVDDSGAVPVAKGKNRLVARACEVAESDRPARCVRGRALEQGADVLQSDHTFAGIVEELGVMFDTEHIFFELEAVGFIRAGSM